MSERRARSRGATERGGRDTQIEILQHVVGRSCGQVLGLAEGVRTSSSPLSVSFTAVAWMNALIAAGRTSWHRANDSELAQAHTSCLARKTGDLVRKGNTMSAFRSHVRLAALLSLLVCASAASASAVFSSDVRSRFTITPFGPVTDIRINTPFSPLTGNGSVDTDVVSGGDVHPVEVHAKVSGSASASTTLASSAAALRGHLVEIDRATPPPPDSPPTVTVEFLFEIFWDFDLSVDMPFLELADAGAYFAIAGFEAGETLTVLSGPGAYGVGGDGKLLWEFDPFTSIMSGVASTSGSAEIRGTITVDSGVVGAFSVITDSAGSASAQPVPEPAGWALVVLALGVLASHRRARMNLQCWRTLGGNATGAEADPRYNRCT